MGEQKFRSRCVRLRMREQEQFVGTQLPCTASRDSAAFGEPNTMLILSTLQNEAPQEGIGRWT
jgi:hypothetical protein